MVHSARWFARYAAAALVLLLALAACTTTPDTVARVGNVTLTQQELDARVQRRLDGAASALGGAQQLTPEQIERQVVELFLEEQILLSLARERGISIEDQAVESQIEEFRTAIAQSGGSLDDVVRSELGFESADSTEFRQFVMSYLARLELGEQLVDREQVRQELSDQIMAQTREEVDQALAAHILVETEEQAREVLDRLAAGEDFAALASELSQDPGSAANGGELPWAQRGDFVPEFDQAIFDQLEPGEITEEPVQTSFGYHIIKLLERETRPTMTEEEAQQLIEQNIEPQVQQQAQAAVQNLIVEARARGEEEGTITAPEYADQPSQPAP